MWCIRSRHRCHETGRESDYSLKCFGKKKYVCLLTLCVLLCEDHESRRATWAFSELNWWHTWDVHMVFLKKHFYLFIMKQFLENRKHMSKKVQAIYLWWHKPVIDQELLQSLPNLKVIVNSGARMGRLGLKLVASFGVKMAHARCAVSNCTADRLVEGSIPILLWLLKIIQDLPTSYLTFPTIICSACSFT